MMSRAKHVLTPPPSHKGGGATMTRGGRGAANPGTYMFQGSGLAAPHPPGQVRSPPAQPPPAVVHSADIPTRFPVPSRLSSLTWRILDPEGVANIRPRAKTGPYPDQPIPGQTILDALFVCSCLGTDFCARDPIWDAGVNNQKIITKKQIKSFKKVLKAFKNAY